MSQLQGDRIGNEPPGAATPQNNSMHDDIVVPPPPTSHIPTEPSSTDHSTRPLLPTFDHMDLMNRISGLYRLLDLISEDGSGGAVDKVVIDKLSVEMLANKLSPGSYVSMTKIDFQALGRHIIRPLGIYGSASAIVKFLGDVGCVGDEVSTLLNQRRNAGSGVSRPALRPGLYLLDARHIEQDLFYVIFWPETDTWDDNAFSSVSRNRVTFMRYLTKLCDQVHCLISDEDGERIVWKHEHGPGHEEQDSDDESDMANFDRLFTFKVAVTNEQEETATINEGFMLTDRSIARPDVEAVTQAGGSPAALQPMLVVGDQSQAILSVEYVSERSYTVPLDDTVNEWQFQRRLEQPVQLDSDIDIESLRMLIAYGLESKSPHYLSWKLQFDLDRQKRGDDQMEQRTELSKSQRQDSRFTTAGLIQWLTDYAVRKFPALDRDAIFAQLLSEHSERIGDIRPDEAYDVVAARLTADPALVDVITKEVSKLDLDSIHAHKHFQRVKKRLLSVDYLLCQGDEFSKEQVESLIGLILTPSDDFRGEYKKIIGIDGAAEEKSSLRSRLTGRLTGAMTALGDWIFLRDPIEARKAYHAFFDRSPLSDRDYLERLVQLKADRPAFGGVIGEIFVMAHQHIASRLSTVLKGQLPSRLQHDMNEREKKDLAAKCQQLADAEEERSWQSLKDQLIQGLREKNEQPTIIIKQVKKRYSYGTMISLQARQPKLQSASYRYTFHRFMVTNDDKMLASRNPRHICHPKIHLSLKPTFELPIRSSIKFIRVVGQDKCLLVVADPSDAISIYLEEMQNLKNAIDGRRCKRQLSGDKVGPSPLIAFDEIQRLLVIYVHKNDQALLHVFVLDQLYNQLGGRGSPTNLSIFFPGGIPLMRHLCFVAGTEELLLVDENGKAMVFSMLSGQFRPATLQLRSPPEHVWSTPDGACLLALDGSGEEEIPGLQCFHWSSFGSNDGTNLELPQHFTIGIPCSVTSVGHKNSLHFVYLQPENNTCRSQALHITHKLSQYAFKSQNARYQQDTRIKTHNNSLIDCHAEVWTRYPVWSPIRHEMLSGSQCHRRGLTFISSHRPDAFKPYFDAMVREFERTTRKPTNRQLANIDIAARPSYDARNNKASVSELQAGDWIATLFCLIPVHIAVTSQNRFIPLKDGVMSSKFEDSVLGFDVAQIASVLSIGFYESIFTSYMANKPVRVVTSMGEQSVGKSYALNHLMDTSFAGSAMRCTEGVWLSATPTRDALIVAMDFEGVHSLERSAQEDALLVLFNVALSNLILFRNNFAFSRDIAGLFTSFQSSTKVLDPQANPSLFRSTLAIIIKDVIDSDMREIVQEFESKFQGIVQEEGAANFMTTLHRGNVDILPWPIINSPSFYKLFNALKLRLDSQPITHPNAREFLRVLKTLMAKLKTNDWGALDQNLATQRAQQLRGLLPTALAFGVLEPQSGGEPLKNLDNDEILGPSSSQYILYVPHASGEPLDPASCLAELRTLWPERLNRYKVAEADFISGYNDFLQGLVKERLELVGRWLQANTARFGEHSEVQGLMRAFKEHGEEMKASTLLCGSRCSSCGLLCLEMRRHVGEHDCKTTHRCAHPCERLVDHEDVDMDGPPSCGLPAAHAGSHFCDEMKHVCGEACDLVARDGCLTTCSKIFDHPEKEHLCASPVHACGVPCDLKFDGQKGCKRVCVHDCTKPHERHCCEFIRTCPIRCQLCPRGCATPDHFHALDANAIHLCGQEHACPKECQQRGICDIATKPQAIEETFVGKFGKHQYTKYTQQAQRQLCAIPIPPNKLVHDGSHCHSQDPKAFHYCEERCPYCHYYCTLPLGHPQQEHDTRHGSMEQTKWFLEAEKEGVEVGGHKYGNGDSGAPMLCSLVCQSMGRHVHIADCVAGEHRQCVGGAEVEHIATTGNAAKGAMDWVTHNLYWKKSGFKDPYSQAQQADFAKCSHQCPGEEHDTSRNTGATLSFCTLPLFHQPAANSTMANSVNGHVSADGHVFPCKNPAQMQRAFHVIFVIDQSGSMGSRDNLPLANSPVTQLIVQRQNNRFGAALSSLYSFCKARDEAVRQGAATGARRDAYSIILFNEQATVRLNNDFTSSPDQIITHCLNRSSGGTNFNAALRSAQSVMESNWSTERSPVIVFLSDGECGLPDQTTYDICNSAVRLGKGLSFHTVSFGPDTSSQSLRRMAQIAEEVYRRAPRDPLAPAAQESCGYTRAIDTIRLAETFLNIANSLKGKRAALRHT